MNEVDALRHQTGELAGLRQRSVALSLTPTISTIHRMDYKEAYNSRKDDNLQDVNSFHLYNAHNASRDINFIAGCNQTMDTLLVFAGLFSAIVTAFIIQNQQLLDADQDRTNELLVLMILQLNRTTIIPPTRSSPSGSTVANVIFFASLSITLIAALAAMLVKQWVQAYGVESLVGRSARETARSRARSWRGVERYSLNAFIAVIPMLLHIGLAIFFIGILVWSYEGIDGKTFYTIIAVVGLGLLVYVVLGTAVCFDQTGPFKWPFSKLLQVTGKGIHSAYRKLFPTGVVNPPIPLPVMTQKLITYEPQSHDIEDLPPEPLEVVILQNVIETSLSIQDTCTALEDIRCMMLREPFEPLQVFSQGNGTTPSTPLQRILLQKCLSIAASSVAGNGQRHSLVSYSIPRAHMVCMFLETYLQIDFAGNTHYDILNQPPMQQFADALHDYGAKPDTELGDIVLAISVRALLSHKVFKYDASKGCMVCFTSDIRPVVSFFKRSRDELFSKAIYNLRRAQLIHRYIRVLLITLTDCLLHHAHGHVDWKARTQTEVIQAITATMKSLGSLSDDLKSLKTFIEQAKIQVPESDELTTMWLDPILLSLTKSPPKS
ncbi:hypothetical protein FS842_004112 [Serendipita sp. 407]|nr:hypothetical protein FS842_004112 [Serendipita sp. 407]